MKRPSAGIEPASIVEALFAARTIGVALLDRELRYVRVNDVLAEINRTPADEHVGRTSAEVIPQLAPRVTAFQRRVLESAEPLIDVRVAAEPDEGRGPRTFRASYVPVLAPNGSVGGVLVTIVEATALAEAEAAARLQDELFRQVAENVDAVFWLADPETNAYLYVSPAYESLWGLDSGELLRGERRFLDYVHPEDRERASEAFGRIVDGYVVEFRVELPDGRTVWAHDHAFPIRAADGAVVRVAGITADVTERRQLEAQLVQAQKLESLGRLAGGIAHDFNNYLTAMNGFGQLALLRASRGDDPSKELREVLAAGERAAQLTGQLLAFGRARSHHVEPLDLNGVVAVMEGLVRGMLGEGIDLVLSADPSIGVVHADPGQLEQVVMNLVVNARDAMPEGGTLTIATRSVDAAERAPVAEQPTEPRRWVELAVTDTGSGMDEETRARALEPFFTTKEPGSGTGLGLAVVYGIARSLEGEIEIASAPGRGTTVAVRLPEHPHAGDTGGEAPPAAIETAGSETVLVVEDEDAVRSLVRQVLEECGYGVLEARSGEEALALLSADEPPVDILVSDVVMPQMGGPELARLVAARRPLVKVLFISGYSEHDRVATRLGRADALLHKPFTPDELARRVRALLDRS